MSRSPNDHSLQPPLPISDLSISYGSNIHCLFNVKSPKPAYTADQQTRLQDLINEIRNHISNVIERKNTAQNKDKIEQLTEKEKILNLCLSLLENNCTYKEFHTEEFNARQLKNNFARSNGLFSASKTDDLVNKAAALSIWLSSCLYQNNRKIAEDDAFQSQPRQK